MWVAGLLLLGGVLRAQGPQHAASLPHLLLCHRLQLGGELDVVVRGGVGGNGAGGLLAGLHALVALLNHGLQRGLELGGPVQRPALRRGGAVGVHPVHAILRHQGVERAQGLLNCLVEGLRRGVPVLPEHVVLRLESALEQPHQHAALPCQVTGHLLLKGGLEHVPAADPESRGQRAVLGLPGEVLVDGPRGVNATALEEVRSDGQPGALGRHKDHIDVLGRDNPGLVPVHNPEPVREVQGLALGHVLLQCGPHGDLSRIGNEVLHNRRLLRGLLDADQILALHPPVLQGVLKAVVLLHPHDDVEALVAEVEALPPALGPVPDDRGDLLAEDVAALLHGVVAALNDGLFVTSNGDGADQPGAGHAAAGAGQCREHSSWQGK
eukprot:RCo004626